MSFEICVPASSANLGPGFDSLALALDLYLHVSVDTEREGIAASVPPDLLGGEDLIKVGVERAADILGQAVPDCSIDANSEIPVARGLGSSAAAIVAGLQVGAMLAGEQDVEPDFLIAAGGTMEGHADNVSAAVLGGLTAAIGTSEGFKALQLAAELPWSLVLFVPSAAAFTHKARGLLPEKVPLGDASANIGRTALLLQAIREADDELLGWALEDRLHQPYRAAIFPHLMPLIECAKAAGGAGGCLSGAGPSVLLFVPAERIAGVSSAVAKRANEMAVPGEIITPAVDTIGLAVR